MSVAKGKICVAPKPLVVLELPSSSTFEHFPLEGELSLVFMGTPEFSAPILKLLVLSGYEVVSVYTQPDKPAGRGLKLAPSPVKATALSLGLTVVSPVTLKGEEAARKLAGLQPDVVVVSAYAKLLPESILRIPRYGCVNVHPSLLPRHRGASPIPAAILDGDKFTGVTIMLMDKGLDTGPILSKAQIPVLDSDTAGSLSVKLSLIAASLIVEVIPRWVRGEITPCPQDSEKATYSKPISKDSGEIDWMKPAGFLWREVRAYNPWPGSYTTWQGKKVKILEAVPLPSEKPEPAGKVMKYDSFPKDVAFGIAARDGILGIRHLQLEGKKAMTSSEFLLGQREFIGSILPS